MKKSKNSQNNLNIILPWFSNEGTWNEGRTFQKVAEHLSLLPQVKQVIVTFSPTRNQLDFNHPLKINRLSNKLALVTANTSIVPVDGYGFRARKLLNKLSNNYALSSYLRLLGFRKNNTILWTFPPNKYIDDYINNIPHTHLIGHIVDNFLEHNDPWLKQAASHQYPLLIEKANLLIVGSQFNKAFFSQNRNDVYCIENAVDEDFIAEPSALPLTKDRPVTLGYIGTLSERTDHDLLSFIAKERPDWNIIIAGKTEIALEALPWTGVDNIDYRGVLPYKSLPKLMATFDVCLIPHKDTTYSESMSPLKLFQYLASGRPIVSTNIEGINTFKHLIRVASSTNDFISEIENTLNTDTIEQSYLRINAAKAHTWEKAIQSMFELVEHSLSRSNT